MPERIGLDLGTSTITAVLVDSHAGTVRHSRFLHNDSNLPALAPTRAEQDPARLRALALEVITGLAARAEQVEAIGVTGQMHGLVCVDRAGEPLTSLVTWQDRRSAEPGPGGAALMDELYARLADLRWQDNGCQISHGYGAATLFWLARHGAIPPGTERVCSLPDWLAAQLAGQPPVTDPTLACSWGAYSLIEKGWNLALIQQLGLDPCLFPPVRPSGEPLGGLLSCVARQVGLPAGIPVLNALGDHPASFLASVASAASAATTAGNGDLSHTVQINLGTGGQIAWWVPAFEPPDERAETHPCPGGGCLRVGASLCGGAAYAWLNRTVRAWLAEFGVELDEGTVYARLNRAARDADAAGLRVRPTFLGVRGDPAVQAGAIEGITLDNLRLAALARATLLGLIDELRDLYLTRATAAIRAGHRLLVASGNGVQKNPLLPGLLAERFGLPVELPRWPEPAAVGAAVATGR